MEKFSELDDSNEKFVIIKRSTFLIESSLFALIFGIGLLLHGIPFAILPLVLGIGLLWVYINGSSTISFNSNGIEVDEEKGFDHNKIKFSWSEINRIYIDYKVFDIIFDHGCGRYKKVLYFFIQKNDNEMIEIQFDSFFFDIAGMGNRINQLSGKPLFDIDKSKSGYFKYILSHGLIFLFLLSVLSFLF